MLMWEAACMSPSGYMQVRPQTLQLTEHDNVFALGDIADLTEEKLAQTGAGRVLLLPRLAGLTPVQPSRTQTW
jgi:thioredoxin reductase